MSGKFQVTDSFQNWNFIEKIQEKNINVILLWNAWLKNCHVSCICLILQMTILGFNVSNFVLLREWVNFNLFLTQPNVLRNFLPYLKLYIILMIRQKCWFKKMNLAWRTSIFIQSMVHGVPPDRYYKIIFFYQIWVQRLIPEAISKPIKKKSQKKSREFTFLKKNILD